MLRGNLYIGRGHLFFFLSRAVDSNNKRLGHPACVVVRFWKGKLAGSLWKKDTLRRMRNVLLELTSVTVFLESCNEVNNATRRLKLNVFFMWKKELTIWNDAGPHNRRTNANVCLDKPRSNVRSNNSITVLVWLLSNMFETTVFRISWPNRPETRLAGKKYKNSWIVHFWNDLESCPSWPFFCLAVDGLAFELDYWLRICEDCDLCFVAIVLLFYNYCVAIPLWEIRACPIEKQWEWRKGNSRLFIYV